MDALEAVLTRQSVPPAFLGEPGPDEAALERILAAGSEVTPVVDHGIMRSIYFHDNNGIALEASWWVTDVTGRPADYRDAEVFADPDQVPAVQELAEGGIVDLPATRLA